MKKVTAFIGTPTRRHTYLAVQEFEKNLKQHKDIDFEYVFLSDYRLEMCRGCCTCFFSGEEHCPLKDDRDVLMEKIEQSDGVIFATPTYAYQVTARMKNFIDRLSFIFHRPRYFDKAFAAIVTQGLPLGSDTLKYLSTAAEFLGFHASKGFCVTTLEPITVKQRKTLSAEAQKAADRFHRELLRPKPSPSYIKLVAFRFARTSMKTLGSKYRDYQYYKKKGWFTSEYYYPTSLGPVKRLAGYLSDIIARQVARSL